MAEMHRKLSISVVLSAFMLTGCNFEVTLDDEARGAVLRALMQVEHIAEAVVTNLNLLGYVFVALVVFLAVLTLREFTKWANDTVSITAKSRVGAFLKWLFISGVTIGGGVSVWRLASIVF